METICVYAIIRAFILLLSHPLSRTRACAYLYKRPGESALRDKLLQALWHGSFIEDQENPALNIFRIII